MIRHNSQQMNVIRAWKRTGETPLICMQRVRKEYGLPDDIKSCYTGRLDPMAQGQIVLLYGDQVYQNNLYNHVSKVYEFQAILGISTTSYDALGRHTNVRQITAREAQLYVTEMLNEVGDIRQRLPPCSAFRYKGKPLWKHTQDGTMSLEDLPSRTVHVDSITSLQEHPTEVTLTSYTSECVSDIRDVQKHNPDSFNFKEILADWKAQPEPRLETVWRCTFSAAVGSGTYIRGLVHDIGERLGIPAHAFRITRTSLGSIDSYD